MNRILCLSLTLPVLTGLCVIAHDGVNATVKCQFSRPTRKQVPAEPLHGVCLRDIVEHLSKELHAVVDEELGVSSFQGMIDRIEFMNISGGLDARLSALVDKFNSKLRSYIDVLKQGYSIVHPVLSKTHNRSVYPSQTVHLDIIQNRISDICTQVVTG